VEEPITVLSRAGRGLRGRSDGGNVTNVQYKSNWNSHYESPRYNEYSPVKKKNYKKEKRKKVEVPAKETKGRVWCYGK
jgi:hypothetical protein